MSYYRKKPVIIEARQYVGTASQTHDVYQVAESAIAELTGTGEGKASQVSREIWTRCEESHGLLCATTSRARGTAVALEAENARLREGIERLCSDIDNPLRERHDESPHDLPEVAEDLRALLADTDSAQAEGGE